MVMAEKHVTHLSNMVIFGGIVQTVRETGVGPGTRDSSARAKIDHKTHKNTNREAINKAYGVRLRQPSEDNSLTFSSKQPS